MILLNTKKAVKRYPRFGVALPNALGKPEGGKRLHLKKGGPTGESAFLPANMSPPFRHEKDKRKQDCERSQEEAADKQWPEFPSTIMSDGPADRADHPSKRYRQGGREIPKHAASSEAYHALPAGAGAARKKLLPSPGGKPNGAENAHTVDSLRCHGRNRARSHLGNAADVYSLNCGTNPFSS
jgi:hypothetical protein